jgi:hypothetical protein
LVKRLVVPCLVGAVACCGAGSYFLYCHLSLGHWNAYMLSGQVGWGLERHYWAPLTNVFYNTWYDEYPTAYYTFSWWEEEGDFHMWMNHTATLFAQAVLFVFVVSEVIRALITRTGWRERAGLYLCAAFVWYVPVVATWPEFPGMIRYVLCVQVFLVLAGAHLLGRDRVCWPRLGRAVLACTVAALFIMQLLLAWMFTHGEWVA